MIKRTRNKRGGLLAKAELLGVKTLEKEALEAEIKSLRDDLNSLMSDGESLSFIAKEQDFLLRKRLEDKAILKTNATIFEILGKDNFIETAKVSKTALEELFGKAAMVKCIERYEVSSRLILSKKEKGE